MFTKIFSTHPDFQQPPGQPPLEGDSEAFDTHTVHGISMVNINHIFENYLTAAHALDASQGANVDMVTEMINMIAAERAYKNGIKNFQNGTDMS